MVNGMGSAASKIVLYKLLIEKNGIGSMIKHLKECSEIENRKNEASIIPGQVYIFRMEGTNYYKIGYTTRIVSERLQTLQIGCPISITKVFESFYMPYKKAYKAEQDIHNVYKNNKKNGEWYDLSELQLEEIKKNLDKICNNEFLC